MSKLVVLEEVDPASPLLTSTDGDHIAAHLAVHGVRFERWELRAGDDPLVAYADSIAAVTAEGYTTVDVAQLHPDADDPEWAAKAAAARGKFLDEHTHADDEVRFFVDGRGAFYLRIDGHIDIVMCEAGDLISVPKGTRHWFDMGTTPSFAALRFFRVPEGWVGEFTGDPIASRFPTFDELVAPSAA
jgi:1,2-dihydroxy-3-keto-5-methylthiopentene dioxygenase